MLFSGCLNATNKTHSLTCCEHAHSVSQTMGDDEVLHISELQVKLVNGKCKISCNSELVVIRFYCYLQRKIKKDQEIHSFAIHKIGF